MYQILLVIAKWEVLCVGGPLNTIMQREPMEHTCNFIRQGVENKLLSSLTQKFGSVEDPTLSTFRCSASVVCTLWWGSVGLEHTTTTRRTTSSEGSRHLQIWGPRSKCCRYISWPVLGRGRAARSRPACCGRYSNVGQNVSWQHTHTYIELKATKFGSTNLPTSS